MCMVSNLILLLMHQLSVANANRHRNTCTCSVLVGIDALILFGIGSIAKDCALACIMLML